MVPENLKKHYADEKINLRDKTESKIVFRKYPWAQWTLGTLC